MTIALATFCVDGLIICADQLIECDTHRYYEKKVFRFPLAALPAGEVALAYSGIPDTMNNIVEMLRGKLVGRNKSADLIQADLQATVNYLLPENPNNDNELHQMLCGFSVDGELHLLKSYQRQISPVPVWDCIGFGDSALTRYLGAIFLDTQIHLPISLGVPICDYIISRAKKYVRGCGGETDLAVLTPEGKVYEQLPTQEIDRLCESIEWGFNCALTSATNPNMSEEQSRQIIKQLRELLGRSAQAFGQFIPGLWQERSTPSVSQA